MVSVTGVPASGAAGPKVCREVIVAVDSTGLRLSAAGMWRTRRYNGMDVTLWVKLHVAVDLGTNEMLAFVITTETAGDNKCFRMLADLLQEGGFDVKNVLVVLEEELSAVV